jgi:tRNA(Ile2) C34 agmatinyltransferase TiaS
MSDITIKDAIEVINNPSHWNDEAWNQGAIKVSREMAVEALQEKAERDKGCMYCKGREESLIKFYKWNNCPMCGKKLKK